ncbi:hypothetical protein HMPREF9064_0730 [Aggregatibacter segnis ATCC 33393]|uniref:Uncharacterized protein n=1 Tax=Aggregatibacter segnis ATCC 33393 TaxID=888057 RepID=E6KX36_9PAST|nr:hypothetical protein HMPREF9064_0730 [Aggregatibacter segnis ATCC 33393]
METFCCKFHYFSLGCVYFEGKSAVIFYKILHTLSLTMWFNGDINFY